MTDAGIRPIKKCPRCTFGQLIERVNPKNGSHFLGCTEYANGTCGYTEALPAYVEMKRQGATELPGFDEL